MFQFGGLGALFGRTISKSPPEATGLILLYLAVTKTY